MGYHLDLCLSHEQQVRSVQDGNVLAGGDDGDDDADVVVLLAVSPVEYEARLLALMLGCLVALIGFVVGLVSSQHSAQLDDYGYATSALAVLHLLPFDALQDALAFAPCAVALVAASAAAWRLNVLARSVLGHSSRVRVLRECVVAQDAGVVCLAHEARSP